VTARDLKPGAVLVTAIGRAPIKTIEAKGDGYEVVLDVDAATSTRAHAQGSVLFFWPGQAVRVAGKAPGPRVLRPPEHDRRAGGQGEP
jgi:hypothetical protein